MRSREYWKQRAIAAEYYAQQDASLTIGKIQELYGNALEYIDEEVQKLRRELGKQTGAVSEDELDELLSASESDKSYRELQNLLDVAKTDEERADILSRMNSQAYGARIKRIDSVGNKILAEFTKVASMEKVLCKDLFSDTYQKGYYGKIYELAKGYNAGVAFDVLPKRAINKALSEPWHGENYSARIWKHSQAFTEQIQQTVVKGLMTGQSRAKLASELMEHTDSTRYVAERLVRTETAHFLSEGQREAYEAAGIEKYRYLAALSERTCEVCASLDNKVFPLDEATEGVNYPTMHPNCRCVTITADAKISTRIAKDPVTGKNYKVDGNMDFQQWKESLSDEQKQAFDLHVRQNKNKSSDKKQYDRYKARLGVENMPKTFDKFQELKYTDISKWEELKGFYKYKSEQLDAEYEHYKLYKDLKEQGLLKGKVVPIENHKAYILEDVGNKDPAHIMKRMKERLISSEDVQSYVDTALFCESQFKGTRLVYYSQEGTTVLTKTQEYNDVEWIAKTVWSKQDFTENSEKILEVARNYVQ